jgi:hypothetical protein
MLETLQKLSLNQLQAALRTLEECIDRCPEEEWTAPVGNHAFCQVAFHTLFYTDYYLGENEGALKEQTFHREHADVFRDYEEFQDREPELLYERSDIKAYLEHCRGKASQVIAAETAESLTARCGFQRREMSRAELYVYNIRHVQHHAAQLSLRLRIDCDVAIPWFAAGRPV